VALIAKMRDNAPRSQAKAMKALQDTKLQEGDTVEGVLRRIARVGMQARSAGVADDFVTLQMRMVVKRLLRTYHYDDKTPTGFRQILLAAEATAGWFPYKTCITNACDTEEDVVLQRLYKDGGASGDARVMYGDAGESKSDTQKSGKFVSKKQVCYRVRDGKTCRFGDSCRFAHDGPVMVAARAAKDKADRARKKGRDEQRKNKTKKAAVMQAQLQNQAGQLQKMHNILVTAGLATGDFADLQDERDGSSGSSDEE
jgi:hypothetical protein